jgi:hypothetical protein
VDGNVLMFAQVMTVIVFSTASFIAIGLGTRILWRRGSISKPRLATRSDDERQQRLETAVDAIAIEVERISEAQRFMVGLLSDSPALRRSEHAKELVSPDRTGRVVTPQ